jgi:hypothetical protein
LTRYEGLATALDDGHTPPLANRTNPGPTPEPLKSSSSSRLQSISPTTRNVASVCSCAVSQKTLRIFAANPFFYSAIRLNFFLLYVTPAGRTGRVYATTPYDTTLTWRAILPIKEQLRTNSPRLKFQTIVNNVVSVFLRSKNPFQGGTTNPA